MNTSKISNQNIILSTMYNKDGLILCVLWMTSILIFKNFPTIDIYISSLFFDNSGYLFFLKSNKLLIFLNEIFRYLPLIIMLIIPIWQKYAPLSSQSGRFSFSMKDYLYGLVSFTISAGILIELVIKKSWSRPRPYQLDLFGGANSFYEIFQTMPNSSFHSFVSGHAAGFFSLSVIGYIIFPQYKKNFLIIALLTGALSGGIRILLGDHFLSDIIFAGLFSMTSILILAKLKPTIVRILDQKVMLPCLKFCSLIEISEQSSSNK